MLKTVQTITDILLKIEKFIIMLFLPIMCILVFVTTFSRFFGLFTDYLLWTEELSRYLMIWMAFIGAALAHQNDEHYKMTAIVNLFPGVGRKIVETLANLIVLAFIIILAKYGFDMCEKLRIMGQTSPVMKLPMWIPYLSIPVGMVLGIIHLVSRELMILLGRNQSEKEDPVI